MEENKQNEIWLWNNYWQMHIYTMYTYILNKIGKPENVYSTGFHANLDYLPLFLVEHLAIIFIFMDSNIYFH